MVARRALAGLIRAGEDDARTVDDVDRTAARPGTVLGEDRRDTGSSRIDLAGDKASRLACPVAERHEEEDGGAVRTVHEAGGGRPPAAQRLARSRQDDRIRWVSRRVPAGGRALPRR